MKLAAIYSIIVVGALACGCQPAPESPQGFRLPDGNPEQGKLAFAALHCNGCHQIDDADLPFTGGGQAVALGGKVTRVKTYGELVTSVINPSHKLSPNYPMMAVSKEGESLMAAAGLNQVMTVQQLVDLVAFLQSEYDVVPPEYSHYNYRYH